MERILYLYADLRRREWPRRGSGRVVFLVRLTRPLYSDDLGLGRSPKSICRLLVFGYAVTNLISIFVGISMSSRLIGAVFSVVSVFGASITDGPGTMPFPRSVRPHECVAMTSVYSTYRRLSRLSMPGIDSLILLIFPLPAVFVASGSMILGLASLARHIPRRFGLDLGR